MQEMYEPCFYFDWLAAAFVRGVNKDPQLAYPPNDRLRLDSPLEALSEHDMELIVRSGIASGLRLHRFKRTSELPRVAKVLSVLQGIEPINLLDIGSGHGTFLWPLLDAFPKLKVTAVDKEEARVGVVRAVSRGGVERLRGSIEDATRLSFDDGSFDVVTILEVIEHVPEAMKALAEAVRVARRYVILSVPAREDQGPQHTHLFSPERLTEMMQLAGVSRITTDLVQNHLIMIGKISRV
jgi:2-polyprenyl-3-methyl-5-hydroxy-6-metoxy-1,4-benzoquinol methylase